MAQKLSNAYVDPSQPGSLGGVAKFAKAHGLTQSKARRVLQTLLSYTLHKPRRRHFPTLPVMVFKVDQQWEMDLMDVQKLAKWNKGHRYILTIVRKWRKVMIFLAPTTKPFGSQTPSYTSLNLMVLIGNTSS